jgi:cell fate regulator YaaT (PSP1 superfamily)
MKVCSVRFEDNNKEYYFKYNDLKLKKGMSVIVDTANGNEYAYVIDENIANCDIALDKIKKVIRIASDEDCRRHLSNIDKSQKAYEKFKLILKTKFPNLDMSLVKAQYNFDCSKLMFIYVSDDRVDFRELLKVLASQFKTRIELKQIGSRDKAKLIGGLGPCGMETCCSRFIKSFDNISISMAKNQMLSLNPQKISGLCGRLLCCLKYENEMYTELKQAFPRLNSILKYDGKDYKVSGYNVITEQVKLETKDSIKFVDKSELVW